MTSLSDSSELARRRLAACCSFFALSGFCRHSTTSCHIPRFGVPRPSRCAKLANMLPVAQDYRDKSTLVRHADCSLQMPSCGEFKKVTV